MSAWEAIDAPGIIDPDADHPNGMSRKITVVNIC